MLYGYAVYEVGVAIKAKGHTDMFPWNYDLHACTGRPISCSHEYVSVHTSPCSLPCLLAGAGGDAGPLCLAGSGLCGRLGLHRAPLLLVSEEILTEKLRLLGINTQLALRHSVAFLSFPQFCKTFVLSNSYSMLLHS